MNLNFIEIDASEFNEILGTNLIWEKMRDDMRLSVHVSPKRPASIAFLGSILRTHRVDLYYDYQMVEFGPHDLGWGNDIDDTQAELIDGDADAKSVGVWLDLQGNMPEPTCNLVDLGVTLRCIGVVRGLGETSSFKEKMQSCIKAVDLVEQKCGRRNPMVVILSAPVKIAYLIGFIFSGLGRFPWIVFVHVNDDGKFVADGDRDWAIR